MTEFEDLPEIPWEAGAFTREAEAAFARCHAITGHGPAVLNRICDRALRQSVTIVPNRIAELERQVTEQGAVILDLRVQMADLLLGNRELTGMIDRVDQELADMTAERDHALLRMEAAIATSNGLIDAEVQRRIAEAAAIFERAPTVAECGLPSPTTQAECAKQGHQWHDTSTGQICAACMVRRGMQGPLGTVVHVPPFPANALRHQRQPGGLLSTADGGKVRLGGYAPSLPPR